MSVLAGGNVMVSLKSVLQGGVEYARTDIEQRSEGEAQIARWETTKVVEDAEEHARAVQVRGQCVNMVRSVCAKTAFGLICPASAREELGAAKAHAQEIAAEFNATAKTCRIRVYVLEGVIADQDSGAIQAIASEVRELLSDMSESVGRNDASGAREAVSRAAQIVSVLNNGSAETLTAAIGAARTLARALVRADKVGETHDSVLTRLRAEAAIIERARASFAIEALPQQVSPEAYNVTDSTEVHEPDFLGDVDASRAVDRDLAGHKADETNSLEDAARQALLRGV